MPSKEIKALRQSGRLQEAHNMAKAELDAQPDDIWAKRSMGWVLYDFLKQAAANDFELFKNYLDQLVSLHLPKDEKMLFDHVAWQLGKMVFHLAKEEHLDQEKISALARALPHFSFTKPSDGYSFLFKAFHKVLKETNRYMAFADWWGLQNFQAADFQKEKLPNGRDVMSIAEQGIIAYAKHLLPQRTFSGELIFDKEKAENFLSFLDQTIEAHPECTFLPYFKAKLLLSLGDQENMLSALLPFAKKKRNDYWVWDVLSEAFQGDEQKKLACYCKALTCKTSDEFLINIRQKMASWFISHNMFNEAKTEIGLIIKARTANGWKIPAEIHNWTAQTWYNNATVKKSNFDFYKKYLLIADNLLYSDIPEETIVIEFVNADKKIANFIASEQKFGFFKYDRFVDKINIGDTLKVRFQGGSKEGMYQLLTAVKVDDQNFKNKFFKTVEGNLKVPAGKPFGFLEDVFVHPSLVTKYRLTDGLHIKANAIKSFNQSKKEWSWKAVSI